VFLVARGSLAGLFVAMTIAGLGVGAAFAVLPRLVAAAVPAGETSSAMGLNQVLRYVGYAAGSAATAAILAAATPAGSGVPASRGYTVVAVVGCGLCLGMAALTWLLPGAGRPSAAAAAVRPPVGQLDRRY
jgi:hypothetical protein